MVRIIKFFAHVLLISPSNNLFLSLCSRWKYFLNPDLDVFPNTDVEEPEPYDYIAVQLRWVWDNESSSYTVTSFNCQYNITCFPDPNQVDPKTHKPRKIPTHRYPPTATPSFYCHAKPSVKTKDDVIYCPNLPTFADKKKKSKGEENAQKASTSGFGDSSTNQMSTNSGGLSQRDSELLLSFMTVPYLRLPLTLTFFSRCVKLILLHYEDYDVVSILKH